MDAATLTKALEDQVVKARGGFSRDGRIFASDLGVALGPDFGGCQPGWLAKLEGAEEKEDPPGVAWMLAQGDKGHEGVIPLLDRGLPWNGHVVLSVEDRVFFEHQDENDPDADPERIGSRLDILFQEMETLDKYVIDIKTKRGNAFKWLEIDGAKPSDVIQLQLYIAATDAKAGFLVYVDREGQNGFRVFKVDRDDPQPHRAVQILQDLRAGRIKPEYPVLRITVRKNKGDDSIYLKDPWQMDWCRLKECRCSKAYGGRSPDGIVAKVSGDEGDAERVVSMKADVKWTPVVVGLLEEKYPDTTFSIKE